MSLPLDAMLIGLASLLATLVAWVVATRAATASRRLEAVRVTYERARVDAQAFEQARIQYDAIIAALRAEIVDLRCKMERIEAGAAVTERLLRDYQRDRVALGLGPLDSARQPTPQDPPDREGRQ